MANRYATALGGFPSAQGIPLHTEKLAHAQAGGAVVALTRVPAHPPAAGCDCAEVAADALLALTWSADELQAATINSMPASHNGLCPDFNSGSMLTVHPPGPGWRPPRLTGRTGWRPPSPMDDYRPFASTRSRLPPGLW